MTTPSRGAARAKRHARLRLQLRGSAERPRLAVYRSVDHIYAQLIDDQTGRTLAAASSLDKELRGGGTAATPASKMERAGAVGRLIGQRARQAGIRQVVFDRAGFRYHGRVRSLAEAARQAGLEF